MPFGAIYGALFFGALTFWLVFLAPSSAWSPSVAVRFFMVLLSSSLAVGLLLRRRWARWTGVAFAGAVMGLGGWMVLSASGGVASFVVLLGALVTVGLLAVPTTGAADGRTPVAVVPSSRSGRLFGVLTAIGALGLGFSLWFGGAAALPGDRDESAELIASRHVDRVSWSDFGTGLEQSRAERKPMLVTFVTNWCGYCRKMDQTTWKHPSVLERMDEVVPVRIDAEEQEPRGDYSGAELAARYQVNGFPTMLLLDVDGRVVARTGGYLVPRDLLSWIEDSFGEIGRANSRAGTRLVGP
jgi:thiol-disulfide isomerase/thioredoxin